LKQRILDEIRARADPVRQARERAYFKEPIRNLGVGAAGMKQIEKDVLGTPVAKALGPSGSLALCEALLDLRITESTQIGLEFLARSARKLDPAAFDRFEHWLSTDLYDNWASTDCLCCHVVGPFLERHDGFVARLPSWTGSPSRWLRRASAVSLVVPVRHGRFLDPAYGIAALLLPDRADDLVQKGNGWLLREAGDHDPERLVAFLTLHGSAVPRTTLRYAIEKFPKDRRDALLESTRARRGCR
jgi:3-methyladenine DNA glycosylase AlkD